MDPTPQDSAARPQAPFPWSSARLAVAGLHAVVVVTVVEALLIGAMYENRVEWATHDTPAVAVLNFLADLIEVFLPLNTLLLITGAIWVASVVAAAVAFVRWLDQVAPAGRRAHGWRAHGWAGHANPYRMVREAHAAGAPGAEPAPVGRWWTSLLVTVPLVMAAMVLRAAVVHQWLGAEHLRDARVLAYPIGFLTVAGVWYTAVMGRRVLRSVTQAHAPTTGTPAGKADPG